MILEIKHDEDASVLVRQGYDLITIYPHREGKDVVEAVLVTKSNGAQTHHSIQVDDFEPLALIAACARMSGLGFDVFKIVPHRHGNEVRATVHGIGPIEPRHREWTVQKAENHYGAADGVIGELLSAGWTLHDILPHRIGADNIALIVAYRDHS